MGLGVVLAVRVASAEVSTDGSLGPAQAIPAISNEYRITDGLGKYSDGGANLFHSFSLFGVESGRTATFSATQTPERVIARVTGGSRSLISGRIRTTEGAVGADLFLLNPAGVTFGSQASLDLKGSFHVSSAQRLRFASGPDFDATSSAPDPPLSIAAPSAFGFVSDSPALIRFSQTAGLSLPAGETFSIVGGPALLVGSNQTAIRVPSGRIQIAAVDRASDVPLDLASFGGDALAAAVTADDVPDVSLSQGFNLDVGGDDLTAGPVGQVVIRGGSLVLTGSRINAANRSAQDAQAPAIDVEMANSVDLGGASRFSSQTFAAGAGGRIRIDAPVVSVHDANTLVQTQTLGPGSGGEVRIAADSIVLSGGGTLLSLATAGGTGGALALEATQEVRVTSGGGVQSSTLADGTGGAIDVVTASLEASDGGVVVSESHDSGPGGNMWIDADRILVSNATDRANGASISALALGAARGGDLTLETTDLEIVRGGSVSTRTDAAGDGGDLRVLGPDRVLVLGVDAEGDRSSLRAFAVPGSSGSGGRLAIEGARVVEVRNGGQISTLTHGTGNAGALSIDASESVTLSGGTNGVSIISAASRVLNDLTPVPGGGGDLSIRTGRLELADGGQISVSTEGSEDSGLLRITADEVSIAGSDPNLVENVSGLFSRANSDSVDGGDARGIEIDATGDVLLAEGGTLSSSTAAFGNAGVIDVRAGGRISLADAASVIASAEGPFTGNGGSIALTAVGGVFLSGDSSIVAESQGFGRAGDVTIEAGPRFEAVDSRVETEARFGSGGRITIFADEIVWLTNSSLSTSVRDGAGGGGDITIDPEFVVLDQSRIVAQAITGAGGNISITTGTFFQTPDSVVDASSAFGIDGTVSIVAPDTDVTSGITTLPSTVLDASALMKSACSAATAEGGSFVISSHPGLPPSPDAPLAAFDSLDAAADLAEVTPASQTAARVALADAYRARGCERAREEVL